MGWGEYGSWTSANTLRLNPFLKTGESANGCLEGLIRAVNERLYVCLLPKIYVDANDKITCQLYDIKEVQKTIHDTISTLIPLFVNHKITDGEWEGETEIVNWTEETIVAHTTAIERVLPSDFYVAAEWVFNSFEIINLMISYQQIIGPYVDYTDGEEHVHQIITESIAKGAGMDGTPMDKTEDEYWEYFAGVFLSAPWESNPNFSIAEELRFRTELWGGERLVCYGAAFRYRSKIYLPKCFQNINISAKISCFGFSTKMTSDEEYDEITAEVSENTLKDIGEIEGNLVDIGGESMISIGYEYPETIPYEKINGIKKGWGVNLTCEELRQRSVILKRYGFYGTRESLVSGLSLVFRFDGAGGFDFVSS